MLAQYSATYFWFVIEGSCIVAGSNSGAWMSPASTRRNSLARTVLVCLKPARDDVSSLHAVRETRGRTALVVGVGENEEHVLEKTEVVWSRENESVMHGDSCYREDLQAWKKPFDIAGPAATTLSMSSTQMLQSKGQRRLKPGRRRTHLSPRSPMSRIVC